MAESAEKELKKTFSTLCQRSCFKRLKAVCLMPAESEIVDIQIRIIPIATPQWLYEQIISYPGKSQGAFNKIISIYVE